MELPQRLQLTALLPPRGAPTLRYLATRPPCGSVARKMLCVSQFQLVGEVPVRPSTRKYTPTISGPASLTAWYVKWYNQGGVPKLQALTACFRQRSIGLLGYP